MKRYTVPPDRLAHADWGISERQAQLLYNILLLPCVDSYLEIGCAYGVSTSAATAAFDDRPDGLDIYFCETDPRLWLVRTAYDYGTLHPIPSVQLLRNKWWCSNRWRVGKLPTHKLAFVDGDHSPENVAAEIVEFRRLQPDTLIVHDTNNPQYPGPAQYLTAFPGMPSIHLLPDRGMFIASRIPEVLETVRACAVELGL